MKKFAIPAGVVLSVAAHLAFGWMASMVGPVAAGLMMNKRAAITGSVVQIVSWAALIAWNVAVAPKESLNLMETLSGLLGGMPAVVVPVLTLALAGLTGFAGGWLGGSIRKNNHKN